MKVSEIADLLGGQLHGDEAREIRGVAGLESAGPNDLTFAADDRALAAAPASRAGCILVPAENQLAGQTTIAVQHPKLAFVRASEAIVPPVRPAPGIHPTAIVDAEAHLEPDVCIGPQAVIERGVKVGRGTRLGAGVVLGEGAEVGEDCVIYPRVTIYPQARVGNRVVLHAGVVVGSDGFGYVFAEGRYHKFPQLGQVIIEDDVEIGPNSTVDRGSLGVTIVGEGTKIDNLCQVAHNVRLGRHCVMAAQSGIAGSSEVGSYAVIGGQVGIADHVRVEDNVSIGGKSALFPGKTVRKGSTVWGAPARPIDDFTRAQANLYALPRLIEKVKRLEKRVKELESK